MKKILLIIIGICFIFPQRYQYEHDVTKTKKHKKYSYVGTKKSKKSKKSNLYTKWGIAFNYKDGWKNNLGLNDFQILGFYKGNSTKKGTLFGFSLNTFNTSYYNDTPITISDDVLGWGGGYDECNWLINYSDYEVVQDWDGQSCIINFPSSNKSYSYIVPSFSIINYLDFGQPEKHTLYARVDAGLSFLNIKRRSPWNPNQTVEPFDQNCDWYTADSSCPGIGTLIGIGYQLDFKDYMDTKIEAPVMMFELSSFYPDALYLIEDFFDDFSEEPGDILDIIEHNIFKRGHWNLTISVMADITKK